MTKLRKFLILSLFVCLATVGVGNTESHAQEMSGEQTSAGSELKDENPQRLESVTGMDQTGEIFEMGGEAGAIEDSGIAGRSRALPVYVVNFRTKGNAVTNYKEYGTGNSGYTNGAYGADAAYLGTYGNKVRFMISGVVGEVDASEVQVVQLSSVKVVSCYQVSGGDCSIISRRI